MEIQRNDEAGCVTNTYINALAERPKLPSVGDIIETLDDKITEKAPCSGLVMAVKDGFVCIGWSDCLELLLPNFNWTSTYYGKAHNGRPYWCIGDRLPRFKLR